MAATGVVKRKKINTIRLFADGDHQRHTDIQRNVSECLKITRVESPSTASTCRMILDCNRPD